MQSGLAKEMKWAKRADARSDPRGRGGRAPPVRAGEGHGRRRRAGTGCDARQRLSLFLQQGRPARRGGPALVGRDDAASRSHRGRGGACAGASASVARPAHRGEAESRDRRSGALRRLLRPCQTGAEGGPGSHRRTRRAGGPDHRGWRDPVASSPTSIRSRPGGRCSTRRPDSTTRRTRPNGPILASTRSSTMSGTC